MNTPTHNTTETETEALDAIYGDLAPQHDSPEAIEAMLLDMAETDGLMTIANILSIDILNEAERTFSVVTDWTDESGADWPTDDAIAAALSDKLGRRVDSVDFSGAGDDLDEAIYTWQDHTPSKTDHD